MKIDPKQTAPIEHETSSSVSTEPSGSTTPLGAPAVPQFWSNRDCKTLNRIVEGIYNYKTSEKSLFTVNHPDHIFCPVKEFRIVNETEYSETLRGSISLLYSMFNEYFPVFNELNPANKVLVIKTIFYECQIVYQGMQSLNYFSDNEEKIYVFYGYYMSRDLEGFFKDPEKWNHVRSLFGPTMEMIFQLMQRMRVLKLNETDVAALSGLIFSQAMINLGFATEALHKFRRDLFTDYHYYLLNTYGTEESGIRGTDVFCLLLDAKTLNFKIQESRAIAKIFISDFIDHWGSAVGDP